MENMESTGLGTPQGTIFDEHDFAAVDKNLSVDAILGMCGAAAGMCGSLESYLESVGSLEVDEDSRSFEERFMMELPIETVKSMVGCCPYVPMSEDEKAAMEAMSAEFIKAWASEAGSETKCAAFLAACDPTPFEVGQTQATALAGFLDAFRPVLYEHFDTARRLIHRVRRNVALKRFTLKPTVCTLDWLDLVVRRRRRWISTTIATVDRLFSLSSCGGCPS